MPQPSGTEPKLPGAATGSLERLCGRASADKPAGDRVRIGTGAAGIERLEARFHGQAFSPHRHDTYAIGITFVGVQTFRFRGERWHCLPGQCHILHPDETHDGGAATDAGFGYRIVYVDPCLIQAALGGGPLPFVGHPVVTADRLPAGFDREIWNIDEEIDEVARIAVAAGLADLLVDVASPGAKPSAPLALMLLLRVREFIAADPTRRHAIETFEAISGLDRWTLARQFRAAFGTSPSHFRTMRQLDCVRRSLRLGMSLAQASAEAGFADQSHMSRHFKKAYGLTPGAWAAAVL